MILEPSLKENKMVELPPLSLYSMTKPQLEQFIPRLIDLACDPSSRKPTFTDYCKPEWWPVNVPWATPAGEDGENMYKQLIGGEFESTDKLRSVVQACYEFMGHTDLLNLSNMDANMTGLSMDVDVMSVDSSSDDSEPEVVDVYVCFYCDRWFGGKSGKAQLEEHVITHIDPAPRTAVKPGPTGGSASSAPPPDAISTSTVTDTATSVHAHQRPRPASQQPAPRPFLPRRQRRRPDVPLWKRPDLPCDNGVKQSEFLKSFGMISSKQAAMDVSSARPKVAVDIDCEIVAVEGLDSRLMPSPRTPRTLMSQLSKDGENSFKKRLSFAVADDGSDGESSEASSSSSATTIQGALLNVPLSSLLGERVKKHMKTDSAACTIKDPEEYCSTVVRNDFLVKLRFRPTDYPITYRRKRKHSAKYCHSYKFNKEQKREFAKCFQTGLNKQSRLLRKQMKPCLIYLKRVSNEEIEFWKEKRRYHGAEWIDEDISILQVEPGIASMQRNSSGATRTIQRFIVPPTILQSRYPRLSTHMFEGNGAQAAGHSRQPMPQFLVKKVEKQFNGHQSSKLVYVPISELQAGPQKRIESRSKFHPSNQITKAATASASTAAVVTADRRPLGPASSSRRKQHFANVRYDPDDDISVHSSQSSDDDCDRLRLQAPVGFLGNESGVKCTVVPVTDGKPTSTSVASKTAKMFGGIAAPVNNVQSLRHFTSHPRPKADLPNLLIKAQPSFSCGVGGATKVGLATSDVERQTSASPDGRNDLTTDVTRVQQQLHIVGDVIYIDDD